MIGQIVVLVKSFVELEGVALGSAAFKSVATKRTLTRVRVLFSGTLVEMEGFEPSSAQGNHTLSTRLFQTSVFECRQDLDHQSTP